MQVTTSLTPQRHARLDQTAVLVVVLLCASWGLYQVSVKVASTGISPALQAGIRSIGSAVLLSLWIVWRRIPLFDRDGTCLWGLAAGMLFALEFLLIYWGLTYTNASRGIIFVYMSPFIVALGAHLFIPGEGITRRKMLGLSAAFIGVAVAFADGLRQPTSQEFIGDLMCFGAAVAWGATTVLIKASPLADRPAEKTLFYQLAVSAVVLPLISLVLGERGVFDPSPAVLLALAYQIVVVAFASYLAWFVLITKYPAAHLAAFTFLTPVFGVLAGAALLRETLSVGLVVALCLVTSGIYLVNRDPQR
jgi:drug/metabolite transporter (DMT)-like permease